MSCLPTETRSELEFVRSLIERDPKIGQCRGPLLRVAFWPYNVFVLEHIMNATIASDVLWDGFREDGQQGVHFELCGAHWFDLAALVEVRALQYRRADWSAVGGQLMNSICEAAGWDAKEISNMFAWQREQLT